MNKIYPNTLLVIIALAVLLGFIGASYYTFPSYDDFSYSASIVESGVWQSQINHYSKWGGRLSSNLIIAIVTAIDPQWEFYGAWSLALLLTFLITHYYLVKHLKSIYETEILITWLTTATVILAALPSIVQFSYWITGAIYYSIGIFATAVAIPFLIIREQSSNLIKNIALFPLTAIIVCNNELSLIGWQQFLLTLTILKFYKYKKWDKFLVFLIIFGSIIGLISLLAPGNFVRQAEFEKSGQLFRTLSNGVLHYFLFSIKLLSPSLIVLIIRFRKDLVAFADNLLTGIPSPIAKKIIFWHWFLFLFSTSALAFWAMGRKPNTRSLNVIMYYYWLMIPFVMWLLKDIKMPHLIRTIAFKIEKRWMPITVVTLFLSLNVSNLVKDYLFNFSAYKKEWAHNMEVLKNGYGKDVVLLSSSAKADTTFFSELVPKRDIEYFKKIYGIKSIQVSNKEDINE